jgi:hypothetical protein
MATHDLIVRTGAYKVHAIWKIFGDHRLVLSELWIVGDLDSVTIRPKSLFSLELFYSFHESMLSIVWRYMLFSQYQKSTRNAIQELEIKPHYC